MRTKELLKNLRKALEQDYLYNSEELAFMRGQLDVLESELLNKNKGKRRSSPI